MKKPSSRLPGSAAKKKGFLRPESVLSEELIAELGGGAAIPLITEKRRKERKAKAVEAPPPPTKNEKKLEKQRQKKEKQARRQSVIESIQSLQLKKDDFEFFQPSGRIGQKSSLKRTLRQEYLLEQRGVVLPSDSRLYKKRRGADVEGGGGGALDQGEEEEEEEADDVSPTAPTPQPHTPAAAAVKPPKPVPMSSVPCLQAAPPRPSKDTVAAIPAFSVPVNRVDSIDQQRRKLPVIGMEHEIIDAVTYNSVVIVCGETGSGKTTQIPQFLYERGFGNPQSGFPGLIGVTQPRRVAAISMAHRVSSELNCPLGTKVGYQVRYDHKLPSSDELAIKFMTDGILLKEMQSDFLLSRYSVIVLDEAHERNVNTDILIGLLSRMIPLRNQMHKNGKKLSLFRLIIMSATLRIDDFTGRHLFSRPPPVIKVEARQFPVTIHFAKRTELKDYVKASMKIVLRIHERLPRGGILVFLTGKHEIDFLVALLNKKCGPQTKTAPASAAPPVSASATTDVQAPPAAELDETSAEAAPGALDDLDAREAVTCFEEDYVSDYDSDAEENDLFSAEDYEEAATPVTNAPNLAAPDEPKAGPESTSESAPPIAQTLADRRGPLHILPLYALLSDQDQQRVFDAVPEGHRLVVVATNVAETSLTIPGIRYVVDTGRSKQRVFQSNGSSHFEIQWISRSSSEQRAGRAGRTGPGHCYRLYSSTVYSNNFPAFSVPELFNVPHHDVLLQLKSMGIPNVSRFPFPSMPSEDCFRSSHQLLQQLGAFRSDGSITELGQKISRFPIGARHGKMLILSQDTPVSDSVLAIISGESVREPFSSSSSPEAAGPVRPFHSTVDKRDFAVPSDSLVLHQAVALYFNSTDRSRPFCQRNGLNFKSFKEISLLYKQLKSISGKPANASLSLPVLSRPDTLLIAKIIGASRLDHLCRKLSIEECNQRGLYCRGSQCPFVSVVGNDTKTPFYIHRSSIVRGEDYDSYPQFIVYDEAIANHDMYVDSFHHTPPPRSHYLKNVTAIPESWIYELSTGTPLCRLSGPLSSISPRYDSVSDEVQCAQRPTIGDSPPVELPLVQRLLPSAAERCQWFLRMLLEGSVLPSMRQFQPLAFDPKLITSATTNATVHSMIQSVQSSGIDSRRTLFQKWRENPQFLKAEIERCLTADKRPLLAAKWERIIGDNNSDAKKN